MEANLEKEKHLQALCDRPTMALPLMGTAEDVQDESPSEDTTEPPVPTVENEPDATLALATSVAERAPQPPFRGL
jgi:hypothetical protein